MFIEVVKRENICIFVIKFGKKVCDIFCSMVCFNDCFVMGISKGILSNYMVMSFDIVFVEV